jgi:hypothetical protein
LENRLIVVDTDIIIDFFRNLSPAADVFSELIAQGKAVRASIIPSCQK